MTPAGIAAAIGDPDSTRTVASMVVLLVAAGVGLVILAVWVHRSTRPDPGLLAPLEVMGERAWRRRDPVWQRRRLDELRPDGAEPLERTAAPPVVDESFDAGPSVSGFDDLRHDGDDLPADVVDTDPTDADATDGTDRASAPVDGLSFGDSPFDPELLAEAHRQLDRELAQAEAEAKGRTSEGTSEGSSES